MKRFIITISVLMACAALAFAQQNTLQFNKKGEFKIVQFTDTHIDPSTPERDAQSQKTFARLSNVVRTENPDLIVFTGDVVTGGPAAKVWKRVIDSLNIYKVPFCIVLGNHDAEQDLTRQQIADIVMSSPYTLNTAAPDGQLADVEMLVNASSGKKTAAAVYGLDSHDYSTIKGIDGYGWFTFEQVDWLRKSCIARTAENGGRPVPALAFFHIVLKEYVPAWRNEENSHIGRAAEDECPGAVNTGMFAAMAETGSVFGTFVGHDHDIDYIVEENGIAMGYGRYSGDNTTYNNLRPGARIIVLKEGERSFESWIREDDGRLVDRIFFEKGKLVKKR